jgi:hypothetical protein
VSEDDGGVLERGDDELVEDCTARKRSVTSSRDMQMAQELTSWALNLVSLADLLGGRCASRSSRAEGEEQLAKSAEGALLRKVGRERRGMGQPK